MPIVRRMVFSDSVTKQGIVEEIDFLVGSNSTSYPIEEKTRNINRAGERITALILKSDGRWQFDDSNNTDLPIATTDLVTNQKDYSFPDILDIHDVKILDLQGNYQAIEARDFSTLECLVDGTDTPIGFPTAYDKVGNSLILNTKVNASFATLTAGLKIYYQRALSLFTTTDTTKVPGIPSIFHRLFSLWAAYDYAIKNSLVNRNDLRNEIALMEEELKTFYSNRSKDEKTTLGVRLYNFR